MTKSPKEIAADLEALAGKATPGPWTHENQFTDEMADFIYGVGKGAVVCQQSDADLKYSVANWPHCAALIVAYRNNHAAIIAALRAAGEVGELRKALEAVAPADPMQQDEQGGCVWCGVSGPDGSFDVEMRSEKHDDDCGWAIARRALGDAT